mgnify:FL=1
MSTDKNEMANVVLPVLEKCFDSDWNMTYSEMVADALVIAGYRQIFDGDCGLSGIKAPDDREAAEAWMRWANLAMDDSIGAIGAMKQMLTELGYGRRGLVQYVVVTQDGGVYDCSFGQNREAAQAVADQATADARSVALNYTYRVAEIVEVQP